MNLLDLKPELLSGPKLTKAVFANRLRRFREALAPNSVAVVVANPEATRSNDTEYAYRQNSDIVYLNGFPEPESVIVVSNLPGSAHTIMFVRPKDVERETWDGIRQGVDGAKANYLATQAFTVDRFGAELGKLLARAENVYYNFGTNPKFDETFRKVWESRKRTLHSYAGILHEMRLVKTAEEVAVMRHAAVISAEAHKKAMLACTPGKTEGQLQAVVEFIFRVYGCTYPAYTSIVAAGNNACVLHYVENDAVVKAGDLVLIDAGGEFGAKTGGYAADITRTFPATGKFTEPQRELYQLVLDAQLAAIAAAVPGAKLINVHQEASRVLRRGLIKLGILPASATAHASRRKGKKGASSSQASLTLRDFFMHGTSHWLGLDVHDVGIYDPLDPTNRRGLRRRVLEPGMVITVEPGLYIRADDTRVPERYRGIGIRIEDDVVITASGNDVLTADVPKSVDEIEALMASKNK